MAFQGNTDPRLAVKYDTGEVMDSMTNTRQTCKHTLDTFTSLTLHALAGQLLETAYCLRITRTAHVLDLSFAPITEHQSSM